VDGKSDAQRKVEEVERRRREEQERVRGGGGGGGRVTMGEVDHFETAKERERRLRKEKETRAKIHEALYVDEEMVPESYKAAAAGGKGKGRGEVDGKKEEDEEEDDDLGRVMQMPRRGSIWPK
jgi:hypothetical protein